LEPPLPEELLLHGKTVEKDLEAFPENPIIGLLVGVHRALGVPIQRNAQLKGVILTGSLEKHTAMPANRSKRWPPNSRWHWG
jgi:delta 1-pyrroline-5-carboxylate dehydrogenase